MEYVVQAALRNSSHGGCLLWGWGWNSMYLSKHYIAFEIMGLRGRVGRSFDINGTDSEDKSYGPDLIDANWSFVPNFQFSFSFQSFRGSSCLTLESLSIPLSLCFLFFVSFPLITLACVGKQTFYRHSQSTSFSFCWIHRMLSGVHLDWQRSSMTMMSPLLSWRTLA